MTILTLHNKAPTGSGKTVLFELALIRLFTKEDPSQVKAVYMAPTKVYAVYMLSPHLISAARHYVQNASGIGPPNSLPLV